MVREGEGKGRGGGRKKGRTQRTQKVTFTLSPTLWTTMHPQPKRKAPSTPNNDHSKKVKTTSHTPPPPPTSKSHSTTTSPFPSTSLPHPPPQQKHTFSSTPWSYWTEWDQIYSLLFSPSPQAQRSGIRRVCPPRSTITPSQSPPSPLTFSALSYLSRVLLLLPIITKHTHTVALQPPRYPSPSHFPFLFLSQLLSFFLFPSSLQAT